MKKKLFGIGLLIILVFKYPPLPRVRYFHTIAIVQVCSLSVKKLALEFHVN